MLMLASDHDQRVEASKAPSERETSLLPRDTLTDSCEIDRGRWLGMTPTTLGDKSGTWRNPAAPLLGLMDSASTG